MSEEEKQMFNKMIYCNLINGEQALKFNRKYEDLQQKLEQLESIRKETIEYINNEIFKRTILVGVGTKKYTRNILDNILNILNKGE